MQEEVASIATALNHALEEGILVFASASNRGANFPITFPARLQGIFCIGSADGLGAPSSYNPPFAGEEKYSALGEAVSGACPRTLAHERGYNAEHQTIRRDGTSTATPIAAGIAALFIDYTWQIMDGDVVRSYENMRKLFIRMSTATVEKDYRYLAPWLLFGAGRDPKTEIKNVLATPPGKRIALSVC
jgi:subtilisin family serine protease